MGDFRVDLVGFPDVPPDEAARRLAEAFGIDDEQAAALVASAPTSVREGVDESEARQFLGALLECGAQVRVAALSSGEAREYGPGAGPGADEPDEDIFDMLDAEVRANPPSLQPIPPNLNTQPPIPAQVKPPAEEIRDEPTVSGPVIAIPPPASDFRSEGGGGYARKLREPSSNRPAIKKRWRRRKSRGSTPQKGSRARLIVLLVIAAAALGVSLFLWIGADMGAEDIAPGENPEGMGSEFQLIRD